MLLKALKYARTEQILQFFLEVVDDNGTTFVQELLGATGIDTVDHDNIEAVLSTNFEGTSTTPTSQPQRNRLTGTTTQTMALVCEPLISNLF